MTSIMNESHMIPSVFDGAGAIEKIVGDEKVEQLQSKVDNMQSQAAVIMRTKPVLRDYKKTGRNDPCPCGSGRKYKNCCLNSGTYETHHQIGE